MGRARGALYWHIKSKEELLFNISIRLINRTVEEARAIALSDMPPIEKLKRLARHLVRSLAENRSGWTVWAQESGALTHERRDQVLAARAGYERIWESALSEAAADGSLYPVDGVQLKGILGMFNSLYLWIHIEGPLPPEEVADKLVSLILDGLRRPLVTTP